MDQQTSQPNKTPLLLQECIQLVLSYLQFNQLPTICSLLRVNKTLFQLTTPILYLNPFLIVRSRGIWSEDEKAERLEHLLRLFISELDPALRAQLPALAYTDEDDEQEVWTSSTVIDTLQSAAAIPEISRGYFYHYRRLDHSFLASRVIPKVFASFSRTQSQAVLAQLDKVFLRHCGERALSICMATPRVKSFKGMIPILKCLRRIELHRMECVTDENLQEMVDWITTHNETHGTLRELQMGGHSEYDNRCYDDDDPNSHLSDLRRYKASEFDDDDTNSRRDLVLLPQAYRTLTELDTRSWSGAWPTIDQIPVGDLFRLVMDYGEGVAPEEGTSFMLRCKGLQVLDLYVPAQDTFRDVAHLFKSRFLPGSLSDDDQSAVATGAIVPTSTALSPLMPVRNALTDGTAVLPPVEKLYISGHHGNLRNALEDAPVGLSRTLRILKVTSMERHTVEKPSITWGYPLLHVEMPFLVDLQLQGDIALEFHFGVLRSCPNLISLKLMVNGLFSCDQPGNPIDPILSLRKLQCLQLLGKWALTREFLKGLGTRLTALKILDLARCYGVELEEVLEAVEGLEFLWRVGWDMEGGEEVDDAEELVARWRMRMPRVTIGFVQAGEFYA